MRKAKAVISIHAVNSIDVSLIIGIRQISVHMPTTTNSSL